MADIELRVLQVLQVLADHSYSASPWLCSCGAKLINSDLKGHQAAKVVEVLE